MARPKETSLPRSLVSVSIVLTIGVAAWALWETQLEGPHTSWHVAQSAMDGVWPPGPGAAPAFGAGAGLANPVRQVAATRSAPPIFWGAPMPHADRGRCVGCHSVLSMGGIPVPAIAAQAGMPHAYRGPCQNCHQTLGQAGFGAGPVGNPVAALGRTGAMGGPTPGAMMPASTMPISPGMMPAPATSMPTLGPAAPPIGAAGPSEVEWLGLEVRQSGRGVIITNAEAAASRAGLQIGDAISSINGVRIRAMSDMATITRNGQLGRGAVFVERNGERLAFELGDTNRPPRAPAPENARGGVAEGRPAGMPPQPIRPAAATGPMGWGTF